jgi:hypothetical protein
VDYMRVLPRDLFNEAKLLKCLGQLCLLIEDNRLRRLKADHIEEDSGFRILQEESDGSIYCDNLQFISEWHGDTVDLRCPLNSREPYPLLYQDTLSGCEDRVFTDDGRPTLEFLTFLGEADANTRAE